MKIIPNHNKGFRRCYFCGSVVSVKYIVSVFNPCIFYKPAEVYACNKCALLRANEERGKDEN